MSTHDMVIANDTFPNVRSDINAALAAIASQEAGTADPPATLAYERQARTDLGQFRRRNAANSGWILDGTLAEVFLIARSSNTILTGANHQCTIVATGTWTQTFTAAATLGDGWWAMERNDGTGVITLDPNASELIDGATTLALGPGDACVILCNGSGFKTVGLRQKGLVLLAAAVASSSATVDFTSGIDGTYDEYLALIDGLVAGTNAATLGARVTEDAGSTWKAGASDYRYASWSVLDDASSGALCSAGDTKLVLSNGVSSTATSPLRHRFEFSQPAAATWHNFAWKSAHMYSSGKLNNLDGAGAYVGTTNAINGIRFLMSSGNIAAGNFALYGGRKA